MPRIRPHFLVALLATTFCLSLLSRTRVHGQDLPRNQNPTPNFDNPDSDNVLVITSPTDNSHPPPEDREEQPQYNENNEEADEDEGEYEHSDDDDSDHELASSGSDSGSDHDDETDSYDGEAEETSLVPQFALPNYIYSRNLTDKDTNLTSSESAVVYRDSEVDLDTAATGYGGGHGG
jgi:hypothetical protein